MLSLGILRPFKEPFPKISPNVGSRFCCRSCQEPTGWAKHRRGQLHREAECPARNASSSVRAVRGGFLREGALQLRLQDEQEQEEE